MRNFWNSISADGRKSVVNAGARARSGQVITTIRQRNNGDSDTVYEILQYEDSEGKLHSEIHHKGNIIHSYVTDR